MIGNDAQPRGATVTVEKATSIDARYRHVEAAPAGKTMFQTVNNSLEEFTSFLHKYQNLNRQRAKESRQNLDNIDIKKISKSAFSVKQVSKLESIINQLQGKGLSQAEIVDKVKSFLKDFSHDSDLQTLGLLSLKQQLKEGGNSDKIITEIDKLLTPAERSMPLKAGALGYSLIEWAGEQGLDRSALREVFQASYPIKMDNMLSALKDLQAKFGDGNIIVGTHEIFKQLSAKYHKSGRSIDKAELYALLKNMSQLKTLLALFDECQILADLISDGSQKETNEPMPFEQNRSTSNSHYAGHLLGKILQLQQKNWVENSDISNIAAALGLKTYLSKNVFGVQLRRIVGLIPTHLFIDERQKQQYLDVVYKFMDSVARSEAEYA
ncbi:hypothetical protein TDB9533_04599 [Thalassocella blandensis]|nr:hypothetical protein TDB9533_04599 [Thalassocella blandensis]